jgi:DNA (cytosine-5)-methyltransferase 1
MSKTTAASETSPERRTLRINGVARFQIPRSGSLVINHRQALNLILASEMADDFGRLEREELPAIVSHWLQSPKDAPILLDASYRDKWLDLVRNWCLLNGRNPATGLPKNTVHPRPVHIDFSNIPFPPVEKPKFTFVDLFAGIGGFRIALQNLGGKCVFSSEWDQNAKETYFDNYGEVPFGDITRLSRLKLMARGFDILAGGFPCQPFSWAGVSARESLGQKHGFRCETQGQLFFDILHLAATHRPRMLLLENVGNLIRHDGGRTFDVIRARIEKSLGYSFDFGVYNTNTLVPQNRVRCIIVAFRDGKPRGWEMPKLTGQPLPLKSILEKVPADSPYTLTDRMWRGHIRRSDRNIARGTGFTAYVRDLDKPSTTLVARYYKDGKECLIPQPRHPRGVPRMLTERECARLQGFPEWFRPHRSRLNAYKQFGNAVPVPLITKVATCALKKLKSK